MNRRSLALLFALTFASSIVSAAPSGRVTQTLSNADQRTRSSQPARLWGMSFSGAGDFRTLMASASTAEAEEQFFLYDSQVAVTCSERTPGRAHRAAVLGCWTHVRAGTATVAIGTAYSGTPTVYNFGHGTGVIQHTDRSGNATTGIGSCFVVPCGAGATYAVVPSNAFRDGTATTYRTSACSNGRPCRLTAECSVDSSSCLSTNRITGVFLGFVGTSTSIDVQIQEAL